MLGHVQLEVGEVVDAYVAQEFFGVRAFYGDLIHVVSLSNRTALLRQAICSERQLENSAALRGNVDPGLAIAKQFDGAAGCFDCCCEAVLTRLMLLIARGIGMS